MEDYQSVCLELAFTNPKTGEVFTTVIDYVSPNGHLSLACIVSEFWFLSSVHKASEQAGFPFCYIFTGVRDLTYSRKCF